jgi:Protein of unknown function (DUF2971)
MAEAAPDANEPEVVYHYTTMDTMMKIAESESIWATSISYLNDVSEGDHFRRLIRQRVPTYIRDHPSEDLSILKTFLNTPLPPVLDTFATRPFVACFSQDSDSLSQWRSYCPNGNGVAVGFRVDCLSRAFVKPTVRELTVAMELRMEQLEREDSHVSELPNRTNVTYGKIDYVDSIGVEVLDKDIAWAIGLSDFSPFHTPLGFFETLIDSVACFKKHPSFSNEREYRLVVDPFPDFRYIEFRATRSTLVPYVPVSIRRKHSRYAEPLVSPLAGRWDFIDRVVVGPTPNKNLSFDPVSAFFQKNGMQVEVVSSTIPYRDW